MLSKLSGAVYSKFGDISLWQLPFSKTDISMAFIDSDFF